LARALHGRHHPRRTLGLPRSRTTRTTGRSTGRTSHSSTAACSRPPTAPSRARSGSVSTACVRYTSEPRTLLSSQAVDAALHVNPKVQQAIMTFMRDRSTRGSMVICDMCTEARNTHLDTLVDLDAVPDCNPFVDTRPERWAERRTGACAALVRTMTPDSKDARPRATRDRSPNAPRQYSVGRGHVTSPDAVGQAPPARPASPASELRLRLYVHGRLREPLGGRGYESMRLAGAPPGHNFAERAFTGTKGPQPKTPQAAIIMGTEGR